jgi:uncharacterized coiled-coil protein SlyX
LADYFHKGEYRMSEEEKVAKQKQPGALERRGFFYTLLGGALAAIAGWTAGIFSRNDTNEKEEASMSSAEARISALETKAAVQTGEVDLSPMKARISALETKAALQTGEVNLSPVEARISDLESKVAEQTDELMKMGEIEPIAELQGGNKELVVFNRKELSVINPDGVLLNLVATNGGVGIRFYKDFGFGNEQVTNPWHMGWIEGLKGYQGLAILRDWRFTAALWDEDGRLLLGRLDPHPPANQPAEARFQVRGTIDEVQAIIESSSNQTADVFQITGGDGTKHFSVNGAGNAVIGSHDKPKEVILHDTVDGSAYSLKITNGRLILTKE